MTDIKRFETYESYVSSDGDYVLYTDHKAALEAVKADIVEWRKEWLNDNDPCDGTDCVTPFDKYLYSGEHTR